MASTYHLYVPNSGDSTVSVVRIPENVVIKTISVPGTNSEMTAVSPDNKYVLALVNNGSSVPVISAETNTVVGNISAAATPYAVAFSPDGAYAYITCFGANVLVVARLSDLSVVHTVTGLSFPAGVVITPDGNYLYVVNDSTPMTVSVIRTSDYTIVTTIPVGTSLSAGIQVVITPDGAHVCVSDYTDELVEIIDTSNYGYVTVSVQGGPGPLAVSPDSKYLYVGTSLLNAKGPTLSVVNIAGLSVVASLALPSAYAPAQIAVTPDGAYAFVPASADNPGPVSVLRTSDNTLLTPLTAGNVPSNCAVSSDGTALYVANFGDSDISVFSVASLALITTIPVGLEPGGGDTGFAAIVPSSATSPAFHAGIRPSTGASVNSRRIAVSG